MPLQKNVKSRVFWDFQKKNVKNIFSNYGRRSPYMRRTERAHHQVVITSRQSPFDRWRQRRVITIKITIAKERKEKDSMPSSVGITASSRHSRQWNDWLRPGLLPVAPSHVHSDDTLHIAEFQTPGVTKATGDAIGHVSCSSASQVMLRCRRSLIMRCKKNCANF